MNDLQEKLESVAKQVRISIDHAKFGSEFVEALMAENLRTASIAIQYALNPDVENVTSQQLVELRNKLGVAQITLFKKIPDDIIGYRSTDPEEIGMGTNNWSWWYDSFQELLAQKPVTTNHGQSMPDYWSGPFEISTANPDNIEKWGYYFDGTTNYLIDPYINSNQINHYNNEIGPPAIVAKLLEANPFVEEITVFNHEIFGTTPKLSKNAKNETWVQLNRRPILYGTYTYQNHENDVELVRNSMETETIQSKLMTIDNHTVYKSFIPVKNNEIPYVIGVVSDYSIIQSKLNQQSRFLALTIFAATILSSVIAVIGLRFVRKRKDNAVQATQETYIHEVNELFTAIRGQRHDFLNQVQTIYTLTSMGKLDELKQYTSELIGDIRVINDIIQIGNPAIAALIQSKIVAATDKKINFFYAISDLDDVKLGVKSVDFVRMVGNLIDNAFDEVESLDEHNRRVQLTIRAVSGYLTIHISNPGRTIAPDELDMLFKAGYSTRTDGQHNGLGLAVTKERVQYYKGTIHVHSSEGDGIAFEIKLPLTKAN